jgi:hypothetical protein
MSRAFLQTGHGPQRLDCLAEDAVRSERVSVGADLPAICDLQGDFQKLQGELILCLSSSLMFLRDCKEFSRAKEQGAFFGIAGKSSVKLLMVAGWRAQRQAGLNARPDSPRSRRARNPQSADRHRRGKAWLSLAHHARGIEDSYLAGPIGRTSTAVPVPAAICHYANPRGPGPGLPCSAC